MKTAENQLRNLLKVNAGFSLMCAFTLIFDRSTLADLMNLSNSSALLLIGIGLMLFVGALIHHATEKVLSLRKVRFIIYQDLAWVLGSVLLLIWRPFNISLAGYLMIGSVALVVGAFAFLQFRATSSLEAKIQK